MQYVEMLAVENNVKLLTKDALGIVELLIFFSIQKQFQQYLIDQKEERYLYLKVLAARKTTRRQADTRKSLFLNCILLLSII